MYPTNLPRPVHETLPTMYDLPSELVGETGLPDEFHRLQSGLLEETCKPFNYPVDEVFTASDLNLYYDARHPQWYKRPDWFLVLDVPRFTQQQELRLSYVIWQEGVTPLLAVELLSPGTEAEDLGQTLRDVNKPPTKWEVYERILRVPYYVVYDRYENNFRAFRLNGTHYEPISLTNQRFWLTEVELGLGLWQGYYQQTEGLWLRWYDAEGWIPTLAERADEATIRVQQEQQRADEATIRVQQEQQRADEATIRVQQEQQRADEATIRVQQEQQRADEATIRVQQEQQRADEATIRVQQEQQRAEEERQKAERLANYLISQGIDPDNLP